MTDAVPAKNSPTRGGGSATHSSAPSAVVFVVSFVAAFAAAGAAFGLGGFLGLGVGVVIGLAGAGVCAAMAAQGTAGSTAKATALLDIALSDEAPGAPPAAFRAEPWATLYREVASSAESKRTASMAVLEIERLRRGAAPPTEEASREPRPTHAPEDLIGHAVDAAAPDVVMRDVDREIADALRPYGDALESIDRDLASVLDALRRETGPDPRGSNGAPAAMVDALVRTAADGIEDLAAGLMRANELAGVAERVTNRATLLALNAALEATRSGSEAFASIAEETRRLAEYAREATDTISRLSSEIEFKVGETIASIQSSSEEAKAAVASLGSETAPAAASVPAATLEAVEALRGRTRNLHERIAVSLASLQAVSVEPEGEPEPEPGSEPEAEPESQPKPEAECEREREPDLASPSESEPDPEPMVVTLDATEDAAAAPARSEPGSGREPQARTTPLVVPTIPDWLEGIGPSENP